MEIKDAIGIYQFLGEINIIGALGLYGLLLAISYIGMSATVKALPKGFGVRLKYLPLIIPLLVLISTICLRIDATDRAKELRLANQVKGYLISNHYKLASLSRIEKGTKVSDREKLIELTELYPNEFHLVFDIKDINDSIGIKLVDPVLLKEIDSFEKEMASILRAGLKNYMCHNCTISYEEINDLDVRYNRHVIELVVQLYPDEFAPFKRNDTIVRL